VTRPNGNGQTQDIERDIDRTRAAIDRTFDAIAGKLTPQQLALDCLGMFRESSTSAATRVVETAREHPLPAAIIGLGIGLLFAERSKAKQPPSYERGRSGLGEDWATDVVCTHPGHQEYERSLRDKAGEKVHHAAEAVKDRVSGVTGRAAEVKDQLRGEARHVTEEVRERAHHVEEQVRGRAHDLADEVRDRAQRVNERVHQGAERLREEAVAMQDRARHTVKEARLGFWQTMESNPLAVAAGALAVGVAAGLLLPATGKERELLGETNERVRERAREMGREVMERGRDVARTAVQTVKSEAERQGLTPQSIVEKALNVEHEVAGRVRDGAREAVREVAGAPSERTASGSPQGGGGSNI
jgi:hypothetical protein